MLTVRGGEESYHFRSSSSTSRGSEANPKSREIRERGEKKREVCDKSVANGARSPSSLRKIRRGREKGRKEKMSNGSVSDLRLLGLILMIATYVAQ